MLTDTNVLVDVLRNKQEALNFLGRLRNKPSISVITVAELISGARSLKEEHRIESLLGMSTILPVTLEIARRAGQWLKHFRPSHGIDDPDALIAATAEHHGLTLATLNVKHFPMFPKLKPPY